MSESAPSAPSPVSGEQLAELRKLADKLEQETQVYLGFRNEPRAEALRSLLSDRERLTRELDEMRADASRMDFALSDGSLYTWRIELLPNDEFRYIGDVIKDREELDRRIVAFRSEPQQHLRARASLPSTPSDRE